MVRIFLDSSVLIAGSASTQGASYAVILLAEIGLIKAVISNQVVEECERNLAKKLPQSLGVFRSIVSTINPEILSDPELSEVSSLMDIIEPKDVPILGAALQGEVSCLLTPNTKDFTPNVADRVGLKIQTPGQFIQEVRGLLVNNFSSSVLNPIDRCEDR